MCFLQKNDNFFVKEYMGQAVLSLNEVYQIYLTKKKQNSVWRKVIENPWEDNVVQIIFHTLDLNLLMETYQGANGTRSIFIKSDQFFLNGHSGSNHIVLDWNVF